ncbi:uncharacterized protein LOC127867642 [Dreissena polymorpha]|uniref:Uncharacterized protein n=1 Tax=Dreissena polymorpha TaxID=45954 RepID=A0A9D4S894_DREPO|nr:uncharacterized protein LOC127867642 [Dreissena polymorpha]KAH3893387.1 hypothetical protein DPMN_017534 [Dreissena polymorpha]
MNKKMELLKFLFYEVVIVTTVYSCPEPNGGLKTPSPPEITAQSDYVIVGEVTEILQRDPLHVNEKNVTYGAMVTVHCTYKGGPLTRRITIGGAGLVPGECFSTDLEKTTYVMFLRLVDTLQNLYTQTYTAEPRSRIEQYLGLCNLTMQYPIHGGMVIKGSECPPVVPVGDCNAGNNRSFGMRESEEVIHTNNGAMPLRVPQAVPSVFAFCLLFCI